MKDALIVIGFVVFWIVLNRWVLPRFGVQTCMSGACQRVPSTELLTQPNKTLQEKSHVPQRTGRETK